jgi:membrane protease YdiL (CAAX protease family)
MSEIPQTSPPYQRDAWLSIVSVLSLEIIFCFLLWDTLNSILPSVSRVMLGFGATIFSYSLPIIYLSFRYGGIKVSEFRLRGLDFVVLFVAFIVLVIVISLISFQGPHKPYTYIGQDISKLPRSEHLTALLCIFLILPFLEETFFRRYIFEIFRNKYKIPTAILLTVLTDTLLHITGGTEGLVSIFFWQMFFTLIYFKSRLGASVIIHCFTNISLYYV